ncbi:hypothetical protein NBRC116591_23420 [Sessilibacter corallicola]|uniref:Uncharacterized protein n=1 Tax=Sessilibacter corallicola TaxID=2904075 RepID=A0ABQ0AA59_9GAMM
MISVYLEYNTFLDERLNDLYQNNGLLCIANTDSKTVTLSAIKTGKLAALLIN